MSMCRPCEEEAGFQLSLISELRKERVIKANTEGNASDFCVFIGVYNAMQHIPRIKGWLKEIDLEGCDIYICDNLSTDETFKWFEENLEHIKCRRITLVQNPRNFGGYGNLVFNLDLMEGYEWVTTLHQDDEYRSDHCQLHRLTAESAAKDLGVICSEATSWDMTNGSEIPYPRLSWLMPDNVDEAATFLMTLQNHFLPFSGASFRTQMLRQIPITWHNAAFPDSELILKAIPSWKFTYLREPTVRYFENPDSESHSIRSSERELGIALSLVRVFTAAGFSDLIGSLDEKQTLEFLSEMREILALRLRDRNLYLLLSLIAHGVAWSSREESILFLLGICSAYRELGHSNTLDLLEGLDHRKFPQEPMSNSQSESETEGGSNSTSARIGRTARELLLNILGHVPRKYRISVFRIVSRSPITWKIFPSWKFRGRK